MNVKIKGKVIDCYEKPPFVNKETGETSPKRFAVHIMSDVLLSNGEVKKDLIDITVKAEELSTYKSSIGKELEISCKLYSTSLISASAI